MIEAFTLKSRGKDMVCLLEYADPSVRGKKVILYKHGFFGNKITPHRIMVAASHRLQQQGYTICRFDCVGAGDSEGDSHYTTIYGEIEDTKVVLHWIEGQLKPEKFMILGYSMGAIVTSVLCHEVPLEGILLWSPCSEPYGNFRHLLGQEIFEEGIRGNDVDFMGDLVPHEFFVGLDAPEIDPLVAIRDFQKPLRLIQGDGDKDVPVYNSGRYEETVPGSVRHVVPGATHGYDKVSWQEELLEYTMIYVKDIMGD